MRTVRRDCTLEDAARCMLAYNIGCLPVTNFDGKLAGILTDRFRGKGKGIPFSLYRFPQVFGDWLPKQGVKNVRRRAIA